MGLYLIDGSFVFLETTPVIYFRMSFLRFWAIFRKTYINESNSLVKIVLLDIFARNYSN